MRVQFALITIAITVSVAGSALNVGGATFRDSHMAPYTRKRSMVPELPDNRGPVAKARRAIQFRRDGAVQGFFDDDYASDADWKKFTEKGGALVSVVTHT